MPLKCNNRNQYLWPKLMPINSSMLPKGTCYVDRAPSHVTAAMAV